ncbi:hypothetical protein SG09_38170 [Bradyrhizobium ottawaense]|uniref:hypothetical protein n=1 Tax=Bradyrhizobium ottawaense TaxID=931866 RepID=UPI001260B79B|nr:hypothetical protein [Bradyrhizobium ottawaense]BBO04467.1 hypothetical protein SG09_38170 [Bradyrhizobium ottawaense]
MRKVFFVLIAILFPSQLVAQVPGTGTAASGAIGGPSRFGPPPAVGRAATVKAAAGASKAVVSFLNNLGLKHEVEVSLDALSPTINQLLKNSGQAGVLVAVDVEVFRGEQDFYQLAGGKIHLIGAGSSPHDVYLAFASSDRIGPLPVSKGAMLDNQNSYTIWFTKTKGEVNATTESREMLSQTVAREYIDVALRDRSLQVLGERALQAALQKISDEVTQQTIKQRIAQLRNDQEANAKKLERIQVDLQAELDRAQRAQAMYVQLSFIAGILSIAQQVAAFKAALGSDAPPAADHAQSTDDLKQIAQQVQQQAEQKAAAFKIDYSQTLDAGHHIQVERLNILRVQNYPATDVPQLRVFGP